MGTSAKRFLLFVVFFLVVAPVAAVPLAWVGALVSDDALAEIWKRAFGYTSGLAFGWYM